MRRFLMVFLLALITAFALNGCGGGGGGDNGVTVKVTGPSGSIGSGASVTLTATVTGSTNKAVTWSIVEGTPAGGTLSNVTDTTVTYTAPKVASGVYHVKAVSKADPTKSATFTINVQDSGIVVTLTAPSGKLYPADQITITATVTGTTNKAVTWSIVEGEPAGGILTNKTDTSVTYTAPVVDYGVYHVKATSKADPTKSAQVEIIVDLMPPPPPDSD